MLNITLMINVDVKPAVVVLNNQCMLKTLMKFATGYKIFKGIAMVCLGNVNWSLFIPHFNNPFYINILNITFCLHHN